MTDRPCQNMQPKITSDVSLGRPVSQPHFSQNRHHSHAPSVCPTEPHRRCPACPPAALRVSATAFLRARRCRRRAPPSRPRREHVARLSPTLPLRAPASGRDPAPSTSGVDCRRNRSSSTSRRRQRRPRRISAPRFLHAAARRHAHHHAHRPRTVLSSSRGIACRRAWWRCRHPPCRRRCGRVERAHRPL